MAEMRMKFADFVFSSNPCELEIKASTKTAQHYVFNGGTQVSCVSLKPTVVKGSGEFFGDEGERSCNYLMHMLRKRKHEKLLLPSGVGIEAYLSSFTFARNSHKSSISYSFEFTECPNNKTEVRDFAFTVCRLGENAFDIADRCSVSVNDIMRLNDFRTPFEINEGDRVIIR